MKTSNVSRAKLSSNRNHKPTTKKINRTIYLDNHATTPLDPVVLDEMMPYLTSNYGNAASAHSYGIRANFAVDNARLRVAQAINANEDEVFFTSGATESNNFAIKGIFEYYRGKKPHLIVSNIEHKCILEAAKQVKAGGAQVTILKVNKHGQIEPDQVKRAIRPNTVLVSIMMANNEIGSINGLKAIAKICHEKGVLVHSDAAQAVGKMPLDVKSIGLDMMSASGHKFYGPKGVGFMYIKKSAQRLLTPLLSGGGQEGNLRSGTLNVPGIVGIGKAIELSTTDLESGIRHYLKLRDSLYAQLLKAFPDMTLNGPAIVTYSNSQERDDYNGLTRLPHNLNITLPSIDSELLNQIYSVAFSSTSACSSGDQKPSYVLMAIGRSPYEAMASLRFGVGRFNTQQDIDAAVDIISSTLRI